MTNGGTEETDCGDDFILCDVKIVKNIWFILLEHLEVEIWFSY